ncbi:hypothetical protein B5X24_HaOG201051 [Helicoverpa armigera]|uniref:Uncharacterized protein n=1 Tax=Helicoverpa armigera TaxID=29058 RepID=A0A2W1BS72_HELAM|nr:hypothetical protein B5X24_HaOG201051 [Helicoverpa armigera]
MRIVNDMSDRARAYPTGDAQEQHPAPVGNGQGLSHHNGRVRQTIKAREQCSIKINHHVINKASQCVYAARDIRRGCGQQSCGQHNLELCESERCGRRPAPSALSPRARWRPPPGAPCLAPEPNVRDAKRVLSYLCAYDLRKTTKRY